MEKKIVLDMDGTFVDFYNTPNWLFLLDEKESELPYQIAEPLVSMKEFNRLLKKAKKKGYKIIITTALSKGCTEEFGHRIIKAKLNWLKKYGVKYDEIHFCQYTDNKSHQTKGGFQILIDDEIRHIEAWENGIAIQVKENRNVLDILKKILFV